MTEYRQSDDWNYGYTYFESSTTNTEIIEESDMSDTTTTEVFHSGAVVTFDGVTYAVPPVEYDDVDLMLAFEEKKYATITKLILGPDNWIRFTEKKRKMVDLITILNMITEAEERIHSEA